MNKIMPIVAVEEDYDEVSQLLLVVPEETGTNPNSADSSNNVFATTLITGDSPSLIASLSSSLSMKVETQEDDNDNDNNNNENIKESDDVFELCSLASSNHSVDQLNRSIGNSNHSSSRRRKASSSSPSFLIGDQLNLSIGNNSTSSGARRGLRNTPTSISSIKRSNSIIVVEEEDSDHNNNDGADSENTFELCSIPSTANLTDLHNNDPLNISLSNRSISRSIGNSTSSRQYRQYQNNNSSNMKRSTSIGSSKHLKVIDVVPIKDVDIDTKYFIDYSREIGRGTKTIVRKCIDRSTGNRYAVKTVKKSDKVEYDHMRQEANLLSALNHPSIIKIYDTYEDQKNLHIVVEICKGGELYDHVIKTYNSNSESEKSENKNKIESYSNVEEVAAVVVHRVVDAVAYLHDHDIVHRDLKLENLLFKSKPDMKNKYSVTDIRVIDFGLSRRYNTHHRFKSLTKLTSFVGTKFYVSPEVLNHSYTHACDAWSIGILAYALLCSKAPFSGRNDSELFDKIKACDDVGVDFPSPDFDNISDDAKDFIRCLLVKDESIRPTACELLNHPWMIKAAKWKEEIDDDVATVKNTTKPSVFKSLFSCFSSTKK